jgi:hypothetical protein
MTTSQPGAPFLPERDHRALARLQTRLERWLDADEAALFEPRPTVSQWSPAQHVYHASLANELSLQNVLSLVNCTGLLRRESRGGKPGVEEILQRGRLPRGVQSPRFVAPPPRLERPALLDALQGSRAALEAVGRVLGSVAEAPWIIPHQVLGALDARRWLRFARVHSAHHLRILGAIAGARRAGSAARSDLVGRA